MVGLTACSMFFAPFITVNAEDELTTDNNVQTVEVLSEENTNESLPEATVPNEESAAKKVSSLRSGSVNEYGFDPEFFQWLVTYGFLPASGVTQADLDSVTEINSINYQNFSSLAGIEQFNNLWRLVISNCPNISDQELTRLYDLENLNTLQLTFNEKMLDVSKVVPIGPQLTGLAWSSNGGYKKGYTYYQGAPMDISALNGQLPNVKYLDLGDIPLLGTESLDSFTQLQNVSLYNTGIDNINFIDNMPNLTSLNIADNRISDLSPVANRTNVRTYAADQLIILYGYDELPVDLAAAPTFTTDWSFKYGEGQYADLKAVSTSKVSAYSNTQITWSNITASDLLGITYKDPLTMQSVSLKTIGAQYSASTASLPAHITAYNGAIYQSVVQAIDVEEPVINDIYEDETTLSGTAPAGMTVEITCPHGNTFNTTADAAGDWSITTDGDINDGDVFTAVTVHASGQTSDDVEQTVKPVTYKIDAHDVTMTVSQLQSLRSNGNLEAYIVEQSQATAEKVARTTEAMPVHADITPLQNINTATTVQITIYVPADTSNSNYDANNVLTETQIAVSVTADGNSSLPNTGQNQMTPIFIGGAAVIVAGIILSKRNNKQRK